MKRQLGLAALACFASLGVAAQSADIMPGLWAISMEVRAPAAAGFQPPPFAVNKCFTQADARDPSRILGDVANPGASECKYTDRKVTGNTFGFAMQCGGTYALQSQGEITFGPQTMDGTITSKGNVSGTQTEFQSKISAKRVGDC